MATALISLPTVMFSGFSLLRLLTARRLNEFQVAYFRAGHAQAGVLLVLSLAVLDLLGRTDLSQAGQWIVGTLLVAGVQAQSGGMFVPHAHRQARAMVSWEHADQHWCRASGRSAADDRRRGDRQLTALCEQGRSSR